jgi:predicted DNA-binding ribbon-helix-helix protein
MSTEFLRRNVTVNGHRTSISLEASIWDGLAEICSREGLSLNQICSVVEANRGLASRTSALRTFILNYFRMVVDHHEGAARGQKLTLGPQLEKFIQDNSGPS